MANAPYDDRPWFVRFMVTHKTLTGCMIASVLLLIVSILVWVIPAIMHHKSGGLDASNALTAGPPSQVPRVA